MSEKIGQTTIETTSRGRNWQSGAHQWSENTNAAGRALVTPDEVLRWRPDHALLLQMGQLPARLPARFWRDWPQSAAAPPLAPSPHENSAHDGPPLWTPDDPGADHSASRLSLDPDAPLDPEGVPSWKPV